MGTISTAALIERLNQKHPNARYELNYESPLQLLVATILAAQCTDVRVNEVTKSLFKKYPDARAYANASLAELEEDVRPTGFYRNKAKAIQSACRELVDRFGGEVPRSMEDMLTLPGVARKTANVVLNQAYRLPTGIIVDSHVARVTQRMGLVRASKPEQIEQELMDIIPKNEWIQFGPAMVLHGRYTCTNSNPKCSECVFDDACPKIGVDSQEARKSETMATANPNPAHSTMAQTQSHEIGIPSNSALPDDWLRMLATEISQDYFQQLMKFVAEERRTQTIYPPEEDVFNAFKATPFAQVKVLLLGQDPYHGAGQAHGMCFSVRPGVSAPPSLKNMFKELAEDLGCTPPNHGCLEAWANQGVMLLNAVLTVREATPNSHKDRGWERFTDAVIRALNDRADPVVFVLWGAYAQKKGKLINQSKHVVIESAHPSPLSVKKFFGSKPYSKVNEALKRLEKSGIDWQIPNR